MTTKTIEAQKVILTVAEAKYLCNSLSRMTRSVKIGFKKVAETKEEFKDKYEQYINMRDDMIDQVKDFADEKDNHLIEIAIKENQQYMLKEFVAQQIHLFNEMLKKGRDDLNNKFNDYIIPLQTISFKIN